MPEPALTRSRFYFPGAIACLLIVYIAAYAPALTGGFIWDDDAYVSKNATLQSWAGLVKIWTDPTARTQFYPLVFTSFWIETHLWGLHTLGFHCVNLLLHALNAALLWKLLKRLQLPGAAFAVALFLLHPVEVESVAWITERKNVLSGFFYLLALHAWLRFDPLPPPDSVQLGAPQPLPSAKKWYVAALILFIAALLSKTVTCSLPAVILLLIWWRRGRIGVRDVARTAPFFAVGLCMGLLTAWLEKKYVGAVGTEFNLSAPERILVAGRALWFYATKLVWPTPLSFIYERWHVDASVLWQWLFPLAAVAVIATLFALRNRIGRGPLVAVLCFAGTLLPALGFFNVYPHRFSFVADHFQYLASVFLMVLLVAVVAPRLTKARWIQAAVVLLSCGSLTWRQAHAYQNLETLWLDTLDKNPECWMAHCNYGNVLMARGDDDNAAHHYREALKIYPQYIEATGNLAGALDRMGDVAEAERLYNKAIAMNPGEPKYFYQLGGLLLKQGRGTDAIKAYEAALRVNEAFDVAHADLAGALMSSGRTAEALEHYRRALELNPANAKTVNSYGAALAQIGKSAEALEQFARACSLDPNYADAFVNWGIALSASNDRQGAGEKFLRALEIEPANPGANFRLAELLAAAGQAPLAAKHYRLAIQARPDWPAALARCAWLLATTSDATVRAPEDALMLSDRALKLSPPPNTPEWLLDVRAAALAAAGKFQEAAEVAGRAEALAREQNHAAFADLIAARKKLYESKQDYREGPPKN